MPSFQAWSSRGRVRACAAEMPSGLSPAAIRATFSNSSAAWIRAFEGMQPTLRQVPPGFFASTTTVSMPS